MKTNYTFLTLILSFMLLIGATAVSSAQTTIYSNNFESNNGDWTDGGGDCEFRSNDDNSPQGNASWRLRDNSGSSNMRKDFDISGFDQITLSFTFRTRDFNTGDNMRLEVDLDGNMIGEFRYGQNGFNSNNTNYTRTITISSNDYTFNEDSDIKFELEGSDMGNDQRMYIDEIEITGTITIPCDSNQTLLMEKFDGIGGTSVSDLTGSSNYPNNPSSTSQLTSFEIETNTDNNYGVRVRGNIVAPQTGNYTFWIAGDDNVELWLSTDNNASNRVKIAYHDDWTNPQQWDKYNTQKSASIPLTEGETYYIEALMKEGAGGDNLAVGWAKPGQSTSQPSEVIPCSVLAPFVPCVAPITYAVTGSDLEYCTGDTDTTAIGLNNSQTGITYQLLRDDTNDVSAIAGTGSAIDFGDFSNAGTYIVVATRTNGGCTANMTGSIVITENTTAAAVFEADQTTVTTNDTVSFTNTSTNANSYSWNFGDGNTSTDTTPTHTFAAAGTYTVTLTATNNCGDTEATQTITVTNAPIDIAIQDFDGATPNWSYTTTGNGTIGSLGSNTTNTWGNQDGNDSAEQSQIVFNTISTEGFSNLSFSFDYYLDEETEFPGTGGEDFLNYQIYYNESTSADYSEELNESSVQLNTWLTKSIDIPAGTTSIKVVFNYDVNFASNDFLGIDNIKVKGSIDCSSTTNDITDATATAGDTQASLSWSNPNVACYSIDEVMVVAKATSAVATAPSGNGNAYSANATFGSGTAFDGGYVVYKGTAEAVSITGLTNGTTYHLTTFTREGTTWSSGITVTVTPIESPYLFFEDFEDEADEAITGTDVNGIGWSATLNGHNANYFGVDTQNGNKLFRADDLEDDRTGIKWESNTINIAGKTDLELSAYLEFDGTDSNDYLRVKVLVDGFFATTVASFDDDVDNQDGNKSWLLVNNSGDPITGNTLKIIIEFFHDSNDEYLVDNIRLTDGNYWLGNESDLFTNTEKWSYKEVPTATSTAKIANGAHLKLFERDVTVKNFTVNGELTIEKDASLTTTEDFKNTDTGTTILNSGHDEFSSLLVQGEASGSISYNRWVNNFEAGTNGNDVIASPVTGESWSSVMANNQSSIFNNGTLWSFTPYINGGTGWGNIFTSSTDTTIASGLGYRVGSPAGNSQTVKFTGELVNGAVTVQLSRNQTRWNVVGNPYSTYIDLAKFIQVNQAQLDEGYVLVLGYSGVNNTDGWAYYNMSTALDSNIKIAPGQGFYLAAKNNNSTIVFNPSMKTVSGADDFLQDGARSAVLDMQKFRLNINNGNKARHAEFYFFNRDDVSDSFDLGYDALIKNDGDNFNLYSTPLDGTVNKLAIQTSHLDNMETSIIPVGVKAQAGQQLTFSMDNLNIADNIIIWLEDRATGVWTEMNDGSTYILNTTETISGTGRFYIHFDNGDTLNIKEVETNQINIVSISGNKTIVVNGNLETDSILELYDINGRKVLTKNLERYTTTHRIDARHLPTAAYIVSIRNHTQKVSKQIIIN